MIHSSSSAQTTVPVSLEKGLRGLDMTKPNDKCRGRFAGSLANDGRLSVSERHREPIL